MTASSWAASWDRRTPRMSELGTYCKGCDHLKPTGSGKTCDYMLDTGRRRPCPAGEGCTEHTKRQPDKKKRKASIPEALLLGADRKVYGKLDEARAKELYDQGLGDQRIANALNVAKSTVASWRKRNGLPNHQQQLAEKRQAKTKTTERGTAAEEEKAMKKDNMPAGVAALAPEEVSKAEEPAATGEEAPGSGETLTVRGLCTIVQRLMDFGLGEAQISIAGKTLEDFRCVTVQLGGDVQIDLS